MTKLRTNESYRIQNPYHTAISDNKNLGLIVTDAFIRGIRYIGYKSTIESVCEFIDNSIQAYSERVDIFFGQFSNKINRKPTHIAIVDDGHGMGPAMLRFAMMWGGTHREDDRSGLGRFGYGLPCAAVSLGRRFTIYSKLKRGRLYSVTLDLDVLDDGGYTDIDGDIVIPNALPAKIPPFLNDAIRRAHPDGWKSGTIIIIENLDKLDWTTAAGLRRNLIRQFGVAYHKLLNATSIHVDGEQVPPIDPLFLEPDAELHAIDGDRAFALDPVVLRVEPDSRNGSGGDVILRYAWLPPSFAAVDKSRDATGINANARFPVIKHFHGIIFSRNGRLVDVQSRTPWTIFLNNDRYIRIEIEFSAALDEAFGVTTSKQQISVSSEMWDRLRAAGLHRAIEQLRAQIRVAKAARETRRSPSLRPVAGARIDERVRTATGPILATEADPLQSLLDEITRRSATASTAIRAEYKALLADWADHMRNAAK